MLLYSASANNIQPPFVRYLHQAINDITIRENLARLLESDSDFCDDCGKNEFGTTLYARIREAWKKYKESVKTVATEEENLYRQIQKFYDQDCVNDIYKRTCGVLLLLIQFITKNPDSSFSQNLNETLSLKSITAEMIMLEKWRYNKEKNSLNFNTESTASIA